jgi:uncharacterized protein involved in exopolysaccharide biosynthesis
MGVSAGASIATGAAIGAAAASTAIAGSYFQQKQVGAEIAKLYGKDGTKQAKEAAKDDEFGRLAKLLKEKTEKEDKGDDKKNDGDD